MKIRTVLRLRWIDIVLGALLLWGVGLYAFLFYFFVVFIILSTQHADLINRTQRLFFIKNQIKLTALVRKQKISNTDLELVLDSFKSEVSKEEWSQIEKDLLNN